LVSSYILSSQSVASHKSVATIKSVAKKLEAKLWQELVRKLTYIINKVWQNYKCDKNQTQVKQLIAAKIWLSKLWLKTKQTLRLKPARTPQVLILAGLLLAWTSLFVLSS
jgi:hypothetical protein